MDRTDPLDASEPLTHRGPGHAPALWLALPLLAGCLLGAESGVDKAGALAVGSLGLAGAMLALRRSAAAWSACVVVAGTALGAAWHEARCARMAPWQGERDQADLFVEVGHVERRGDAGWRMTGWVETGPPDTRRRRVLCSGSGEPPAPGSLQVISGILSPCGAAGDPAESWRRSQGISLRLGGARVAATIEAPGDWDAWVTRTAARLESGFAELAWDDRRGSSLLAATMLGRTSLLEAEDRQAFATTGTLHLFAISGLHIAGMAMALAWLGRRCRLEPRLAGAAALAALWVYVELTGGTASARRAWIMAACILACTVARRKPNAVQGLAVACALTLLLDPEAASDAGFQLSYASVAGILLVGAPAARALSRPTPAIRLTPAEARPAWRVRLEWLRARATEGLCISLAASTASTALTLGAFGALCPGGVVANLLLVPLSGPPVLLGMLSTALAPVGAADGPRRVVNGLAAAWLRGMAALSGWLAEAPFMSAPAHWRVPPAGAATAVAVLLTMLLQPPEPAGWRLLARPLVVLLAGLALGAAAG